MDGIQILLLITVCIGIFLMVLTLVRLNKEDKKPDSDSYFEIENNVKAINSSVGEAEKAVEELNKFAESILSDIDDKYQELLFLYNLIEEKKNETMRLYGNYDAPRPVAKGEPIEPKAKALPRQSLNPKYDEIVKMHENGMSVSEISKNLDMGQGEVKLILELSRAR